MVVAESKRVLMTGSSLESVGTGTTVLGAEKMRSTKKPRRTSSCLFAHACSPRILAKLAYCQAQPEFSRIVGAVAHRRRRRFVIYCTSASCRPQDQRACLKIGKQAQLLHTVEDVLPTLHGTVSRHVGR